MAVDEIITRYKVDGEGRLMSSLRNAGGAADQTEGKVASLQRALGVLGGGAALVGMNTATNRLVQMGQTFQENENLAKESFGGMLGAAERWSEGLQRELGINGAAMRRQAGMLNVMFGSMGLAEEQSYKFATSLSELSQDMASFYNLSPEEAFNKLRAGITGESEPLKQLGILLTETTVKEYAWANGIAANGEALTEQQKVIARYGLIMEQTTKAQGDMARTMDSGANVSRRLTASLEVMNTTIGEGAAEARVKWQQAIIPFISSLNDSNDTVLKGVGALMEYRTQVGNVVGPLTGLYMGYRELKAYSDIARLATIKSAAATTADGNAAAVAAGQYNALALAKGKAAATPGASGVPGVPGGAIPGAAGGAAKGAGLLAPAAFGLRGVAALGLGAAAVGGIAYGGTKLYQGMRDSKLSDEEIKEKHGAIGEVWAEGGKWAGESKWGQMWHGGGWNKIEAGEEAERKNQELRKQSAARIARQRRMLASTQYEGLSAWSEQQDGMNSVQAQAVERGTQTRRRDGTVQIQFAPITLNEGPGDHRARTEEYNSRTAAPVL